MAWWNPVSWFEEGGEIDDFIDDLEDLGGSAVDAVGGLLDDALDPVFDEGEGDSGLIGGWIGQAGGQLDEVVFDGLGTLVDVTGGVVSVGVQTVGGVAGGVVDAGLDIVDAGGQLLQGDFGGAFEDLEDAGESLYSSGESLVSGVGGVADVLWEGAEELWEGARDYTVHTLLGYPTDMEIAAMLGQQTPTTRRKARTGATSSIAGGGSSPHPLYDSEAVEDIIKSIAPEESTARRRTSGVQDKFGSMKAPILDDTTEKRPE